jgi:glycosyltransferase involved in cell wall biosynthesis
LPQVVSLIEPGPVGDWLRAAGIPVRGLGMRRGVASPLAVPRLARAVREHAARLVHSHMFHANLLARAARLLGPAVPLVNSSHVDERGVTGQHRAYRATRALCQRFHCVSRAALERLAHSGAVVPRRLVYIPNGVPEPGAAPGARARVRRALELGEGFVFLSAGRLHPDKDPGNLLAAFARVCAEDPSARLLVAGDGPLRPELQAQLAALRIGSAVRLLGTRTDVPDLMCAADALVIASRSEALPLVLLEAALAGVPVVATSVGDIPEVLEAGRSGLLCAPQDAGALAGRMLELRRMDPVRREQLADALRARVRAEYALGAVVDRFEALYAELLAEP